jgi:hypothetical protein
MIATIHQRWPKLVDLAGYARLTTATRVWEVNN